MAVINLAVGQVNITANFLVAIARKVSDPVPIAAKEEYPTPLPTSFNVVLPESGELDPVNYYVDFYESSNGTALDFLLATFVVNAKNNIVISETRYYKTGGGGVNPEPDQDSLIDPYLDGKNISLVFKDGMGRPFVPQSYVFKEYELIPGGGVKLLNGQLFSYGEVVVIVIDYLAEQVEGNNSNAGMYNGVAKVTASLTLDSSYRNKKIRCVGASSRMVITLEDVSALPEGTFWYFTHNNGNQFQTRIVPASGGIQYYTENYSEITIAPGEFLRIVKVEGILEAELVHDGVLRVGEHFAGTWKDHPNTKPENGALYDGDDYPRPWWWINNKLPAPQKIVDDAVINPGYTHPAGKEGLFVVHSTQKKFRLPNTQAWSERGLKSFTAYGTDTDRTYDFPGGTQPEMIGPHSHSIPVNAINDTGTGEIVGGQFFGADATKSTADNIGTENRVKNFGVVYLRRF